jgi:hypothetical protein
MSHPLLRLPHLPPALPPSIPSHPPSHRHPTPLHKEPW